jgi:hypothetical protein
MVASIVIDGIEIAVGAEGLDREGRTVFGYSISGEGVDHHGHDLKSGCGSSGREDRDGLASLLSFLGAAAEAYAYFDRTGFKSDNEGLFPQEIAEWAYQHADEISMAAYEYENPCA